jgi:hypothetical protein
MKVNRGLQIVYSVRSDDNWFGDKSESSLIFQLGQISNL